MIKLLQEYNDFFSWLHQEIKGLDSKLYQHQINLAMDMKPVQQWRYWMNPNYAPRVKEEIDKLLKIGFIHPVKRATWLSSIIIVPKKNAKISVCVDYRKLNQSTLRTPFPFHLQIAYSMQTQVTTCIVF